MSSLDISRLAASSLATRSTWDPTRASTLSSMDESRSLLNLTVSFPVLIEGHTLMQVIGGQRTMAQDVDDDEAESGIQLVNEVESGGTLSSLFTILRLFTEDVKLRYEEEEGETSDVSHRDEPPNFHLDSQRRTSRSSRSRSASRRRRPPPLKAGSSSSEATVTADADDSDFISSEPGTDSAEFVRDRLSTPPHPHSGANSDRATPSLRAQRGFRGISTPPRENTIARAAVDTTLAVIPAEAFRRLTKKFPNAVAHIVQGTEMHTER
jgi:lysophospholipid hydrolase